MCAPDGARRTLSVKVECGSTFCWTDAICGCSFLAVYLTAIALGFIRFDSLPATGTKTVHVLWFGWFLGYKFRGLKDRWVQVETVLVLCTLFQLAVGAFAFSRLYYGPLLGHERDLFQELSSVYIAEDKRIPSDFADWWVDSSRRRFVGLAWYVCEVMDILAHQAPFVGTCLVLSKERCGWEDVIRTTRTIWPIAMITGPIHRLAWDYCTCGHAFCDGPYRGFLRKIASDWEQFLWHLLPNVILVAFLLYRSKSREARRLVGKPKKVI